MKSKKKAAASEDGGAKTNCPTRFSASPLNQRRRDSILLFPKQKILDAAHRLCLSLASLESVLDTDTVGVIVYEFYCPVPVVAEVLFV